MCVVGTRPALGVSATFADGWSHSTREPHHRPLPVAPALFLFLTMNTSHILTPPQPLYSARYTSTLHHISSLYAYNLYNPHSRPSTCLHAPLY